jgi:DNA-binding NarL/FixJ family response regulator
MEPVRVLVVDNDPEFGRSTVQFLSTEPRIEIVGRSASAADALRHAAETHPHLVLIRWDPPDVDALAATRQLKAQPHPPLVAVLCPLNNGEYRAAVEAAGADGAVATSEMGTQLLPLIFRLVATRHRDPE